MIQNFFGDFGETAIDRQQYGIEHFMAAHIPPDDEFQFSEDNNYVGMEPIQQEAQSRDSNQPNVQAIKRIQEEQARINELLREKSNKEYQEKQKRKEEGRRQYEEFMVKKQQQIADHKQSNRQKQRQLITDNTKLSQQAGWKKVVANVPLKQGEHNGVKDITRMREALVNKRNDEIN